MTKPITRRGLITGAAAIAGAGSVGFLIPAGCTREMFVPPNVRGGLTGLSDVLTMSSHRLMLAGQQPAPEFAYSEITRNFPTWGTTEPEDEEYQRLAHDGFRDWRLPVLGLVDRPLSLSLEEIKRLPSRTQITSHNCEMGWSAIGQWTGTPLLEVLKLAGMKPEARYVAFQCVDGWYDSLDMFDVVHPQTLLAYGMNGGELPMRHGAPLRLRAERHCGYKSLKFLKSIHVVANMDGFGAGRGSMVADDDWHWYAGA
jgi:DMSO/TMAO reductase YedYZ molybdopterin-dependent catalytic subunit